jgi:hypothetical protein
MIPMTGYTGGACEMRVCPRGIDPVLNPYNKGYPSLFLSTYAIDVTRGFTGGSFRVMFQGRSIYLPANVTLTNSECKAKFEALPNIGTVQCIVQQAGLYSYQYNVTFLTAPLTVYESNIYSNNGTYFVPSFSCNTSNVDATTASCDITDLTPYNRTLPSEYWHPIISSLSCCNACVCWLLNRIRVLFESRGL